jgi:hypothetical protein
LKECNIDKLNFAYDQVGDLTWLKKDFKNGWLESSRALFDSGLEICDLPVPKELEVYALVSGLQFSIGLQEVVVKLQAEIDQILGPVRRYWVKPENLGVEYCVFKWPSDSWDEAQTVNVKTVLNQMEFQAFHLYIGGIQINRDGCVILKGFDQHQSLFTIRNHLRESIEFLPKKQSNWAHIPIGRILNPIGETRFNKLREYIHGHKTSHLYTEIISEAKFVHETRWYMEEHEVIMEVS